MSVSLAQTIELFTHVLSGITVNIIPDKEPKYQTVRLNTGHLATLLENNVFILNKSLVSASKIILL